MHRTTTLVLGILFLSALTTSLIIPKVSGDASNSVWWASFGHDNANTRTSPSSGPRSAKLLWNFTAGGAVRTSPAVVDGVVYAGTFGGNFYAIDANTGAQIWSFKTDTDIWASPTVANGIVYVGANSGTLFALSTSDGHEVWEFKTGSGLYNGPTIVGNIAYEASTDDNVYALDATTGAKIWSFNTGGQCRSTPAVVNGVVYLGSLGGKIYAVDAAKGTEIWNYTTAPGDTYMDSSPAVVNNVVYIGSTDSNVYALDAKTGAKTWSYKAGSKVSSSPAVANGVVYVGSEDGNLYALDATSGAKIWSYAPGGAVYSSPSVASGVVYIGSWGGGVDALDASTGAVIWTYSTGTVFASPAIANNVVYVGSYDNKVYAFGAPGTIQPSNQTLPQVFVGGAANGTTVASNKVTLNLQTTNNNTAYYQVRVDGGKWMNTGLSGSYTFSGLSLGKHTLQGQAVDNSGQVTGSSNVTVTVSVWVPPTINAVASSVATVGVLTIVSLAGLAVSNPTTIAGNWLAEKINNLLPKYAKDWLESFVSSKRSQVIEDNPGTIFTLTKLEMIAYAVTLLVLTLAFSYSGAGTMEEFLILLPTVLATSVVVGFIKNLLMELIARLLGVWAEYRLWYLGLTTFTLSTLIFKTPFSSPSRILHHSPRSTTKTGGITATASVMITLGFGAIFYLIQILGFPLIGSIGLASCLLSAFFETIPIPLMNGKGIWDWNKIIWAIIFLVSLILYALWLIYL
ncbi:MAG: PQQ-binding-like beta-propeller repeat protein [Candidatus Bathyarchaeia archaeon]